METHPEQLVALDPEFPELMDLRLGCGHWHTVHVASSVFDFPADPVHCAVCNDLRQLAVNLQHRMAQSHWDDAMEELE